MALLFALLIGYISVAFPVVPRFGQQEEAATQNLMLSGRMLMEKVNYLPAFSKSSPQEGWKNENKIPGFVFRRIDPDTTPPRFPGLKKIFIDCPATYTPCKRLILYPYHEFL